MKKLFLTLLVSVFALGNVYAGDAPKTKEVCKEVVGKDGKPVLDKKGNPVKKCKTIKVHKKAEGTKIPEGKKK